MKIYEVIYLENNEVKTQLFNGSSIREVKNKLTENQTFLNVIDRTPKIDVERLKTVLDEADYNATEIEFIIENIK